ncbi:hypothetical protein CKA32_006046 [Geitlerinema sp. FC II]|nr:hypothetical protein CKA32_006046 [Geitlerinema sp. FC II]
MFDSSEVTLQEIAETLTGQEFLSNCMKRSFKSIASLSR